MNSPEIPPLQVRHSTLEFAPIGPRQGRRFVPRRIEATGGSADLGVSMTVDTDQQGTSRVTRLELTQLDGGPAVTSAGLRGLPLARLVREALSLVTMEQTSRSSGTVRLDPARGDGGRGPRRGAPITDEHLRDVAARYRAALECGLPATQTVADEMHASRPTAARWVNRARERGILGPSLPGRAGEGES